MRLNLNSKRAVVTGAGRGIGLATVEALVREGVEVVGVARTITSELEETGAIPVPADLSTVDGIDVVTEQALSELGGVDLLVNNVGGADPAGMRFLDAHDDEWQTFFTLNVLSAVRVTRTLMPSLLQNRGAVVNVFSAGAGRPSSLPAHDISAKTALTTLSRALAEEFGPQGVRVNSVSPGPASDWEVCDRSATPLTTGAGTTPGEVAELITFLLSDRAGTITGADYVIDGGRPEAV